RSVRPAPPPDAGTRHPPCHGHTRPTVTPRSESVTTDTPTVTTEILEEPLKLPPRPRLDPMTLREERPLKHRADGESRIVPCPPELTRILRAHLAEFDEGPDGRVFYGVRGGELAP